jgi:hypothetical protein
MNVASPFFNLVSFLFPPIGICREAFKEEEIEDELVPILVQLGYVHQLSGKLESAMELYSSAIKSK